MAVEDGELEDFRAVVGMIFPEGSLEAGPGFVSAFDKEKDFFRLLAGVLPDVVAFDFRQNAHTGREFAVEEQGCQGAGAGKIRGGALNNAALGGRSFHGWYGGSGEGSE